MPSSTNLKSKLIVRLLLTAVVAAGMLFIPAGSLKFWQAWVYMAIICVPMLPATIYFYKHDPRLVERRMRMKEKVSEQKLIMKLANLIFVIAFSLPGLDYRFGWSRVPLWLTMISQAVVLGSYLMTYRVLKENSFASRIIEVEAGQRVISTGPYRIVRHPLYLGATLMLLFTPFALGSYWALLAFGPLVALIVFRLLNEEKVLRRELPGYSEYCLRTRFRLIPFVW
jgi:protein-S-isoprenylcysteine O-methyltransferase Ste14